MHVVVLYTVTVNAFCSLNSTNALHLQHTLFNVLHLQRMILQMYHLANYSGIKFCCRVTNYVSNKKPNF